MITIRRYREADAVAAGRLIADTYAEFNLAFATPENRERLLGPFRHAYSQDPAHIKEIAQVIRADMVLVAVEHSEAVEHGEAAEHGEIVGVLRGSKERLRSLFVRGDRHRQGIGRRIVERFERECRHQGARVIRLASTLYAVPFYTQMGYKKSTGVRAGWSFGGSGFQDQPMKKVLEDIRRVS